MPVESAVYISDLNSSFPPDADPVGQADDHLRLLKSVLKSTFPNLNGPVTSTDEQLSGYLVPVGMISYWYGNSTNVPAGWAFCDGRTVARSDGSGSITTPNLQTRFIYCDNGSQGTGGASTHSHALTIAGHGLTTSEMAAHTHGINDPGHAHSVNDPGHVHAVSVIPGVNQAGFNNSSPGGTGGTTFNTASANTGVSIALNGSNISIQSAGSGAAHGHPGSVSDTVNHLPPYFGLCPIMKI